MALLGGEAPALETPERVGTAAGGPGGWRGWALAAGAFVAISAAVLSPVWTLSASPQWDAHAWFLPAFTHLSDALREGRLPLWDPYTNCGLPFLADPQTPTLNPLALLLALLPRPALGFALFWTLHWIAAGLGMLLVVRALRGTPAGGVVAALAYAFSGFFVGHAQHTSWIVTAAWLPWALGLAHLAVARGSAGLALLAGTTMALSALGGYPVLVGVALAFLALWLAAAFLGPWARFEGSRPSRARAAARVAGTIAAVAATLLLAWSPVLHAFLTEGAGYTSRARPIDPEIAATFNAFSPRAAISIFFPYFIVLARAAIPWDLSMNDGYLAVLSLPLAAVAFTTARPRRRLGWLLALTVLAFAVSMGGGGRVRLVIHELVPAMKYMRHNAGYRVFWILPLAAAAGVGASLVAASARARRRFLVALLVTLVAAVAVAAAALDVLASLSVPLTPVLLRNLFLAAAVALPAAALLVAGRCRGWRRRALPAALAVLVAVEVASHLRVTAVTAWTDGRWLREVESLAKGSDPTRPREVGAGYGAPNTQQITRTPVARGYVTMQAPGFEDVLARGRFLEVLRTHRFWLTPSAALAASDTAAVEALADRGPGDPLPTYVDGADAALPGEPAVPGAFGAVRILSYAPERLALHAQVPGPGPALLASTERFAPGWRVSVDGVPTKPLRVNVFFRGVLLPPGSHDVTWTYAPARLSALVAVAALAFAGSLGGGLALLVRGRGRSRPGGRRPR